MKRFLLFTLILMLVTGCATKEKNDLQKSPCAGPCFETAVKKA